MEDKRGKRWSGRMEEQGSFRAAALLNSSAGVQRGCVCVYVCVRRVGSLITREKGYTHTHTKHTGMHKRVCTGVDIFSQLHCSLRLAHLDIRGSRTHYQLGGMKGAHGGRRSEDWGGIRRKKEEG